MRPCRHHAALGQTAGATEVRLGSGPAETQTIARSIRGLRDRGGASGQRHQGCRSQAEEYGRRRRCGAHGPAEKNETWNQKTEHDDPGTSRAEEGKKVILCPKT